MANVYFQGTQSAMSSGNQLGVYAMIDRCQDVRIDYTIPRSPTFVLGRFKPLPDQPVINYTPVSMNCTYIKGDKNVETCLGILNPTGLAVLIGNGVSVTDWGARTYPVYIAPVSSPNYYGEYDVVSGVLRSFALQGNINEAVKGSFAVEGLDLQQVANNSAKITPNYSGNLIRSQDVIITGIDFSGLGFSGLFIQSFSFQTSFTYASHFRMGSQFPVRHMTAGTATLQISAFMEGVTNTITSLNQYACGQYISGQYVFTLQPSCAGNQPPTTITLQNPYLDSQSIGSQVGNFIQVNLAFSVPLTIVPFEATGAGMGPNCTIT